MSPQTWTVGMGITSACNMNCPFCYSQDRRKSKDLELDMWKSFMEKNGSLIDSINYGTGENTLSKSWYSLITFIHEKFPDIRQALTTNGSLALAIEEGNCADAIEACIEEIDVSIDFADSERHDKMRGYPGAYDMAVRTLDYCQSNGKQGTIVMLGAEEMLHLENLTHLFDLAKLYNAYVRINLYRHVSKKSAFQLPKISTIMTALNWIVNNHSVVSISEPVFRCIFGVPTDCDKSAPSSMRILPNGDITPSTYLITGEWVAENITHDISIRKITKTTPFQRFMMQKIPEGCSGCPHADICRGGTRDRRFLTWGNLDHPDIYCPIAAGELTIKESLHQPEFLKDCKTVHSDYLPTLIFSPNPNKTRHVNG